MKKTKVCIITSVHLPFDTRIFHKQAKTLEKAGYNVTLIAQHDKDEIVEGIQIISLPKPNNRVQRIFSLTLEALKLAMRQRADIYHFHDPELIPAGLFLKCSGKIIYDVHEDYGKSILLSYYLPVYSRKFIAKTVDLLEYFSSYFFDSIIVATDDIFEKFYYHKNICVVQNFPILSKFVEKKGKIIDKSVFNIIYVGGLIEERGITEIIKAIEYINSSKNIKLILCGVFSPYSYEENVRALKGFKKVQYLGWIKPEDLWPRMIHVDAGIVCLHPKEAFITSMPIKLFEYMAAGLPVIASNFPLWKEIVEGNKCGLVVDPLKPEEIAKSIEYLMENPEIRIRMGENGRKAVLEKYNWEKESQKLISLYEKLAEGK